MMSQLVVNIADRLPVGGEFQGRNGDCVEYAFMVARCSAQPWCACDADELNGLTAVAIDDGEASSSGAMTNAELAWLCSVEGVPFSQTTTGDLIGLAQQWAGKRPICMGFSNGQALPGNEQNVFGHCVAVLDWDGLMFILANGDSANGRAGRLDMVSRMDIAAAQPTQVTVLEVGTMGVYDGYFNQLSATDWQLKANPAIHLRAGLLSYWRSLGGLPGLPRENEQYTTQDEAPGSAYQRCERGILVYDPARTLDNPPTPGPAYLGHLTDPRFNPPDPRQHAELVLNGGAAITVTHVEVNYG